MVLTLSWTAGDFSGMSQIGPRPARQRANMTAWKRTFADGKSWFYGFWPLPSSRAELSHLRAQEQQQQATIDLRASHGVRGAQEARRKQQASVCAGPRQRSGGSEGADIDVLRGSRFVH